MILLPLPLPSSARSPLCPSSPTPRRSPQLLLQLSSFCFVLLLLLFVSASSAQPLPADDGGGVESFPWASKRAGFVGMRGKKSDGGEDNELLQLYDDGDDDGDGGHYSKRAGGGQTKGFVGAYVYGYNMYGYARRFAFAFHAAIDH